MTVALLICVVAGFWLRTIDLGGVGFAEDEINKLQAIHAYEQGNLIANAEHPMFMKVVALASLEASRRWNQRTGSLYQISDEAALRLPNVVVGALTAVPLFLLLVQFFDGFTGLIGAALWATGAGAVTLNRIAKEDTFVVFFMLWAFYAYIQAKETPRQPPGPKRRWYVLSGAGFGLMMASKYFPHYLGLNILYHHLRHRRNVRHPPGGERRGGPAPVAFFAAGAVIFLAANPAVLLPGTWAYLLDYTAGELRQHHGYLMGSTLYENDLLSPPGRALPLYFYPLFLALKTPLAVLAAAAMGLWWSVRRVDQPGPLLFVVMFVMWMVPFSLIGTKWSRYMLTLLPFLYMLAAVGITWCAQRAIALVSRKTSLPFTPLSIAVWTAAGFVTVVAPALSLARVAPHYAAWSNLVGTRVTGHFFPHDEFYDDGVREAMSFISACAPPGALVASETPGLADYYLRRYERTDLRLATISDPRFDARAAAGPVFAVLQRGRTYFENQQEMTDIRQEASDTAAGPCGLGSDRFALSHVVHVQGETAVEVYARAGLGSTRP